MQFANKVGRNVLWQFNGKVLLYTRTDLDQWAWGKYFFFLLWKEHLKCNRTEQNKQTNIWPSYYKHFESGIPHTLKAVNLPTSGRFLFLLGYLTNKHVWQECVHTDAWSTETRLQRSVTIRKKNLVSSRNYETYSCWSKEKITWWMDAESVE